jgi:hypothetical protein
MQKVDDLRAGWEQEQAAVKAASEKKGKKNKVAPDAEDGLFPEEDAEQEAAPSTANLFEDSDSDDSDNEGDQAKGEEKTEDDAAEKTTEGEAPAEASAPAAPTQEDLFGDSSDEDSDEELVPSGTKRINEGSDEEKQPAKKRKVLDDEDEE